MVGAKTATPGSNTLLIFNPVNNILSYCHQSILQILYIGSPSVLLLNSRSTSFCLCGSDGTMIQKPEAEVPLTIPCSYTVSYTSSGL